MNAWVRIIIAGLVAPYASVALAAEPILIKCYRTVGVCSPDGVCIGASVDRKHPITFDLERKRLQSPTGAGSISELEHQYDGKHVARVLSQRVLTDWVFAEEWDKVSNRDAVSICEVIKRR